MSGLFAITISGIACVGIARFFRDSSAKQAFWTVVAGFGFWYWLPALNLLTFGYIGYDDFVVTSAIDGACWFVLANQLLVLTTLVLARPMLAPSISMSNVSVVPIAKIAALTLISSLALLAVRFGEKGTGVFVELATGLVAAREGVTFYNRSEGIGQSLVALWELVNIGSALFCLAWNIVQRRFMSFGGLASATALTLMFVGTGTRAALLQALFVTAVSLSSRATGKQRVGLRAVFRFVVFAVPLLGVAALILSGFSARFSNMGDGDAALSEALVGTLVLHNDMMRELIIVFESMTPSLDGALDFVRTPFTYMLPTFLGFEKEIPAHLVQFNFLRAGIDLNLGQGNVFPGLIADFWLVFSIAGPILLSCFVVLSAASIDRFSRLANDVSTQRAFRIAGFSYLFFSFRNIPGGFALILLLGAGVMWLFGRKAPLALVTQRSANHE